MAPIKFKIRDINFQFIKEKTGDCVDDHLGSTSSVGFISLVVLLEVVEYFFGAGIAPMVGLLAFALGARFITKFIELV